MKISSKGRYGLRCLVYMAMGDLDIPLPLNVIADVQGISLLYLEQVFSALRKNGLVKSIKGSNGGYLLARSPDSITVGEVIKALEGESTFVKTDDHALEAVINMCVWEPVDKAICQVVNALTLETLSEQAKKDLNADALMFYI